MRTLEDIEFDRTTVTLDDTQLRSCTLTNCVVIYSGGKFGWTESSISNCQIVLKGPAALTVSFLEKFRLINPADKGWRAVVLELPPAGDAVN